MPDWLLLSVMNSSIITKCKYNVMFFGVGCDSLPVVMHEGEA